jgi:ankyrin repeat protein
LPPKSTNDVTAFCEALWKHDDATIAALAAKVDPDAPDRWHRTPLMMAAEYGDRALMALLLERTGSVDQQRRHLTPITIAARRRAGDIVQLLRTAGATPSIVTWIYLGERPRVEKELRRDPEQVRLRDEAGSPILHHAVESLRPELVRLLLEQGASVHDTDEGGETALHRIADLRLAPPDQTAVIASLLLDQGAAVDARNWSEVTPLHQAVRARNLAAVRVLLERGADPNSRDKRGSTPLRRAVSGTGASLTAGTGALMAPLTRLLLEHGADPERRDKRGVTVRASARAPEVIAVLDEFRRPKPAKAKPKARGR